ncbi:MAG: hypothetical protein IPM13_16915 [Phycisphaerales bacterium]|nr:hypothetical protein [Phycisphaerales bacterium]
MTAPDEPTQLDVRPKREPEVIEPSAAGQASEPTEPSATTGGSSARTESGVTGVTGLALTRGGAASGVTTASSLILRSEEQARAVALFRLVIIAGLAGIVAVWLPSVSRPAVGPPPLSSGFTPWP